MGVDLHETIDLLNELIRTLRDDQENFRKAAEHVASSDLKEIGRASCRERV